MMDNATPAYLRRLVEYGGEDLQALVDRVGAVKGYDEYTVHRLAPTGDDDYSEGSVMVGISKYGLTLLVPQHDSGWYIDAEAARRVALGLLEAADEVDRRNATGEGP